MYISEEFEWGVLQCTSTTCLIRLPHQNHEEARSLLTWKAVNSALYYCSIFQLRSWMAPRSVRFDSVLSWKLSNVGQSLDGWPKIYYLELLRALEGPLSCWSWARVMGYGPFFLCVIHKEGLCPSSGDINGLMMQLLNYCLSRVIEHPRKEWE
jgi:hypothetical protein